MSQVIPKEHLEDLYEHAPCGYIFTYPDGTIARVNETFLRWTGYTHDDLGATRFQDLLTTPGKIFYENQYASLLFMQRSVKEVAFDLLRKDGSHLPTLVNSTLRTNVGGEPTLIATTIFDSTDRQRYEYELRIAKENAEQLATIVRAANDAILRATPKGVLETWNMGAERLFGYTADEIIGQSVWTLLPALGHEGERSRILSELQAERPVLVDTVGKHAKHHDIDLSVGLIAHRDLLGDLGAFSAIIRDTSERRALERMQQEFLAMASHELRHPHTIIKGHAYLMQRRANFNEQELDTIIAQSDRLEQLIDDLLLASLIEADRFHVHLEPTNLVTEVRTAVEQFANDERSLVIDAPTGQLVVLGDRFRLGQVFTNLLTNAIKYSPEGSEIIVRLRSCAKRVQIDVINEGDGIPEEILPRLISRFYRAEEVRSQTSGLGLGLYIAQRITQAHGGDIEVTSEVDVGSRFTITLPLHVS